MNTGLNGTFVIRWAQSVIDGEAAAGPEDLRVGATWRWSGRALRLDGPDGVARLGVTAETAELHRRAARQALRICGMPPTSAEAVEVDEDRLLDSGFVVSDGRRAFAASRIDAPGGALVAFLGDLPPADADLWVVRVSDSPRAAARARREAQAGVICFAAGTAIATPGGPRRVETLRPGEPVLTRDAGPQPVIWSAARRLSGARLHMAPELRPVRIRQGALGPDGPDEDLRVSPNHRLLVTGRTVGTLFGESEVLVRARDLLPRPGVEVEVDAVSVIYVHLMLERHQVLMAAGLASESFHPDEARLDLLDPAAADGLRRLRPELMDEPSLYGPPARRRLDPGEAAILVAGLG